MKDLNVRQKTIKLLEENMRSSTFFNINHSKILYDPPPRTMEIKTKINKCDLIKLKSICTVKETISSVQFSRSVVSNSVTRWTVAYKASLSMGFSKQEYWSGSPFPSPGDLPDPGIEPGSPALQADALTSEPPNL